jgi:hypothetical protein
MDHFCVDSRFIRIFLSLVGGNKRSHIIFLCYLVLCSYVGLSSLIVIDAHFLE